MLVKISKPRQNTLRREKGQLESKKKKKSLPEGSEVLNTNALFSLSELNYTC